MIPNSIIQEITNRIANSTEKVLDGRLKGEIETEPSFTDRLLARIETDFEKPLFADNQGDISISARTLRDRGRGSSEKKYGADIATVLDVELDDFKVNKGILIQSKIVKNASLLCESNIDAEYRRNKFFLRNSEISHRKTGTIEYSITPTLLDELKEQCKLMLEITPDSFVFLYAEDDIYVVSASSVIRKKRVGTKVKFHCKNLTLFMTEYLKCFLGDLKLNGTRDADFEKLREAYKARNILQLSLLHKSASR
ncbi:hypothetical protein ACA086_14715 [Muriicola sp. E247]|uniref:hypothetical protein n=1 Tax=Muriicola sp. E247 TaxID=3242730 RepID=UPI0035235666